MTLRAPISPTRPAALLGATALLLAMLAGCAKPDPAFTGTIDTDGFRTRHPIVVEEGTEVLDLPVVSQSTRLPVSLASAVETFGREARRDAGGRVTVMTPVGSTNEAAARRVRQEVVELLGRAGIAPQSIDRRTYVAEGPNDAAPVRLSRVHLVARVPHPCGQWPAQSTSGFDNDDYWNFGCAHQANVAAMVANPSDLVTPAPLGLPDATRRATVLAKYRKGEKTYSDFALPSPGVSSVGSSGGGS